MDYGPRSWWAYGLQFHCLIQLLWPRILYGCVVLYRVANMRLPAVSRKPLSTPLCKVTVPLRCLRPKTKTKTRFQLADFKPQTFDLRYCTAKTDAARRVTSQSVKQCRSGMHHVEILLNTSYNLRDSVTYFLFAHVSLPHLADPSEVFFFPPSRYSPCRLLLRCAEVGFTLETAWRTHPSGDRHAVSHSAFECITLTGKVRVLANVLPCSSPYIHVCT